MTPDPELEHRWRERIEALFEDAPEPDADRLAIALSAARARARRQRSGQRPLALLVGVLILGGGMATAAWWASGPSPAGSEPTVADEGKPATDEPTPKNGDRGDNHNARTPTPDDGIIYQRVK